MSDAAVPESVPRFVVGIDLGTTNSAVTYVDTEESPWQVRTFLVPQLVAPGQVEARETLPSFHYEPAEGEFPADSLRLPFAEAEPSYAVGTFARDQGTLVPGRLIGSAKSWLSHSGVDRTADLLPWHGAPDVTRLSPVEVSSRYLLHVREAWDAKFPEHPLAEQDIVLTLPASFDEVARELTVKAAAKAGLPRVVLIEEPQAAFYAWILAHSGDWDDHVQPGQKILVCDIGGGTSDFTLIRVRRGEGDKVQFHRVAVGDHLILGGDNFDLTLAQHCEARLTEGRGKLEPRQWAVLVRVCRQAKETLLSREAPDRLTISVPGSGAKLIGGGLQLELTRDEVRQLLVDGFLPRVSLDEKPQARRSGFQEFGLPYAADAAMTRYLAAFLTAHRHVALDDVELPAGRDPARPDIVLFNGGVFGSDLLRERLLEVLGGWFPDGGQPWQPLVLDNDRLDLAVARGAAYYGMVRRGEGVRIAAGLARSYYIGVEAEGAEQAAVCLLPAGIEPGSDVDLTERQFALRVSEPVEFPFYVSSTRLVDKPGEVLPVDLEQMSALPPVRTVLRTRKKGEPDRMQVALHARLTEIGTVDLWCGQVDGPRTWRLQFDVRSATQTDVAAHGAAGEQAGFVDEETLAECDELIARTFGPNGKEAPEGLAKRLSKATGTNRREWPPSLMRRFWETLLHHEAGRRKSANHEARWLNLVGFTLRPGYGLAVDDWRVAKTWSLLQGKLVHRGPMNRAEWWILWRRICGGLTGGQQQALAEPLLGPIRGLHKTLTGGKGRGGDLNVSTHEAAEMWRFLGSLELLKVNLKIELGELILDMLPKRKMSTLAGALCWTLGRIGGRVPVYGPLNTVVPVERIHNWLPRLIDLSPDDPLAHFAVMQLARRTDDRYRDVSESLRGKVESHLLAEDAPPHFVQLVREGGTLAEDEQGLVFGEALPSGLRIL